MYVYGSISRYISIPSRLDPFDHKPITSSSSNKLMSVSNNQMKCSVTNIAVKRSKFPNYQNTSHRLESWNIMLHRVIKVYPPQRFLAWINIQDCSSDVFIFVNVVKVVILVYWLVCLTYSVLLQGLLYYRWGGGFDSLLRGQENAAEQGPSS